MTIHTYELQRGRARAARAEAAYLRELHDIATCGLPAKFTGYHYGTAQVRQSVAMRMADMYLLWAAEWDEVADRIENEMAQMLGSDGPVHWAGETGAGPTSLHGNGAKSFARTSGDEDEVTCKLCLTLLARESGGSE